MDLRAKAFFRPYVIDGKEIAKVVIYANGQVLLECGSWLEIKGGYYSKDVSYIGEIGRDDISNRRKEDLDRKEHFVTGPNNKERTLYLYAPLLGWDGSPPNVVKQEYEESYHYYHTLNLTMTLEADAQPTAVVVKGKVGSVVEKSYVRESRLVAQKPLYSSTLMLDSYELRKVVKLTNEEFAEYMADVNRLREIRGES